LAYFVDKKTRAIAAQEAAKGTQAASDKPTDEPIATALKMDDLKIEIGYALLPLVNGPDGNDRLTEQIKALRRNLAGEMGFVMPVRRVRENDQHRTTIYVI